MRHTLCAPVDQQPPRYFVGGETIRLLHLAERAPRVEFRLPTVRLSFVTQLDGGRMHGVGNISSVHLLPDRHQFEMVWQHCLLVPPSKVDYLDSTQVELCEEPST